MEQNMARPRELCEPKKTEQFTVRLEDDEALEVYREASRRDVKAAVLLRKAVRLGMAAILAAGAQEENESSSGFGGL